MSTKPILFNTDMVRAILDGRKTVTRRVVKPQPLWRKPPIQQSGRPEYWANWDDEKIYKSPYRPGDTLYVRETFWPGVAGVYEYKADYEDNPGYAWKPSIHMPREVARIFLRVTDVRVERLQDITDEQALRESVPEDTDYPLDSQIYCPVCKGVGLVGALHPVSFGYMEVDCPYCDTPTKRFANFWNSTIKPADRALYGWQANPWVWVIEFERCEMLKGA